MCGLVGVAGVQTADTDKAVRIMLILDQLRGDHSTGIAAVSFDNTVSVVKQPGTPVELFNDKRFDAALAKRNRVIIGHNRYATQGAINKANAHPFEFDGLVGAHNGTLKNQWKLRGQGMFTVDSQQLYHHINEEGIEDAMEYAEGAWALTWWDKYEERMNFLRNPERTLYWVMDKSEKTVFWASEAWMLEVALHKTGIEMHGEPEMFPTNYQISFHVNNMGIISDLQKVHMESAESKRQKQMRKEQEEKKSKEGNVVPFTPTNRGVTETVDQQYLSSKGIKLEVLTVNRDRHGAVCVSLFDTKNLQKRVVVYPRKDSVDFSKHIGKEVVVDISGSFIENERVYYKANAWTIKLVGSESVPEEVEETTEETFEDHSGNQLTKKAWMKKYPSCSWCFDPVIPENNPINYQFSKTNDCICDACVAIPEVKEMM